tara:strand:+ start:104 stop:502 length:399 start_codon:yes stop_codon:yes gene_type:complete
MDSTQIGQAGEYLAAAVLQRHFSAIASPDKPSAYDLIVETKDNFFLRCQVKTSDSISSINGSNYWSFHTHKSSGMYTHDDCDFFAFVVLRKRTVVFAKPENIKSSVYRIRLDEATLEKEATTLKQTLGEWLL